MKSGKTKALKEFWGEALGICFLALLLDQEVGAEQTCSKKTKRTLEFGSQGNANLGTISGDLGSDSQGILHFLTSVFGVSKDIQN